MAANAKPNESEVPTPDISALENIDWDAVEATNPDLAALLRMSLEQNAELEAKIEKGAKDKKAREPQTLAARVNRALTAEPKGLNKHGVTVANTGSSPAGDIDNAPILAGLVRAIEECGVEVTNPEDVVMGDHFLSFALLVYNLQESRAWQPKKGEKAETATVEDDENEDDD